MGLYKEKNPYVLLLGTYITFSKLNYAYDDDINQHCRIYCSAVQQLRVNKLKRFFKINIQYIHIAKLMRASEQDAYIDAAAPGRLIE